MDTPTVTVLCIAGMYIRYRMIGTLLHMVSVPMDTMTDACLLYDETRAQVIQDVMTNLQEVR
jgi:hypothetical protein